MYGMRREHDLVCGICGDHRLPTGFDFVNAYNEGYMETSRSESMQTNVQMSQTAIRLKTCVIEALGEIMNEERLEVVIKKKL